MNNHKYFLKYYGGIFIFLTHVVVFVQLTLSDIGLKNCLINVNHPLQRTWLMEYVIEDSKMNVGIRVLPTTSEVYECFNSLKKKKKKPII